MIKPIQVEVDEKEIPAFQETQYLVKFPKGYFVQKNGQNIVYTDFIPSARKWTTPKKALKSITEVLQSIPYGDSYLYDVETYDRIEIYVKS